MLEMCTVGLVSALTTAQQNVVKQESGSDTPGRSKFSADAWMQGVLLELLQRSWDLEVDSAFPELLCEQVASTSALVSAMQGESSLAELCPEVLSDLQDYLTLLQAAGESPEVAATSVTSFRHEKLELDVGGYIWLGPTSSIIYLALLHRYGLRWHGHLRCRIAKSFANEGPSVSPEFVRCWFHFALKFRKVSPHGSCHSAPLFI